MKLSELAARLECTVEGDGDIDITRLAAIEDAGPGELTFFANPKYADALKRTLASAVIAAPAVSGIPCAVLRTPEPYVTFARALGLFANTSRPPAGIHRLALVEPGAVVAADASIGPFAVVSDGARIGARTILYPHVSVGRDAEIGADCVIHAHVSIRERVRLGDRVVLQDGVVIGADGYGFARRRDGTHEKIPQVGGVVIEDDVEIGANTAVDRPAIGETRIKAGTKIDNLVQIGHGVKIGRNVLLAAQVGIAGSTSVGDDAILGGQVGVAGHVSIGSRARAVGQSGITNSIPDEAFVSGYPAIDNKEWLKSSAVFRRLPDLRRKIAALEERVVELEGLIAESRIRSSK